MMMKKSSYLSTSYKKSFTVLEALLTLTISSVVIVGTLQLQTFLLKDDIDKRKIEILKLDILSTKIFLQKNLQDLHDLTYNEDVLYFKNSVLLKNVNTFEIKEVEKYFEIIILLDNTIKQIWIIKK